MNHSTATYHKMSRNSLLLKFLDSSDDLLEQRYKVAQKLKYCFKDEVIINHGFQEILLLFKNTIVNDRMINEVKKAIVTGDIIEPTARYNWKLPIYYNRHTADFKSIVTHTQLSMDEIVEMHVSATYSVSFMGFLPGFPYLTGLPDLLHIPRKATPSLQVENGSVAIAAGVCGIYPQSSPGGWHVIGNCPIPMFDINRSTPFLLNVNDQIRFYEVDLELYKSIKSNATSTDMSNYRYE